MKIAETFRGPLLQLFALMQRQPLFFLLLLLALQTVFMLESRALWYSDEIRYADVFTNLAQEGKWLVMNLNGDFYPDKPPVFFWLLWVLQRVSGLQGEPLFFLGAAVCGGFYLMATVWLARLLEVGKELRLAAGLVLLTTFYFIGLTHYLRMDLLFASLIIAAEVCLYKAWHREQACWWTAGGFALMALAVLTKGPLGVALPLAGSLAYLWWVRNLRRLLRMDVWRGVLLFLFMVAGWLVTAFIVEGREYLDNILYKQVYQRAVDSWHHEQPFYHYLLTFPAAFLPWTLLVFVLPVKRLLRREFWSELVAGRDLREGDEDGLHYCWCLFLSGFVLLSLVSTKIVVYLLPLFAPLAVIVADTLLTLEPRRSRLLFVLVAGMLGLLGAVLPFVNFAHPWPIHIEGLPLAGGVLLLLAVLLWRFVPRDTPRAAVVFLVLGLTLWLQPVGLLVTPSLDALMSPKAQAEIMGRYADAGYEAMGYKLYSGTYTYYAGHDVREFSEMHHLDPELAIHPKVVLGLRKKHWERWENRPEELVKVHEQWIADRPYVLAVKGPLLEQERKEQEEAENSEGVEDTESTGGSVTVEAVEAE